MAKKEVKSKASGSTMDLLLENTIALQKTLAGLASDLKTLNKKVSDLFELFEAASASFKEAGAVTEGAAVPQELLDKIDSLVEQNKTIARGLLLLEKALREKEATTTPAGLTRPAKPLKKKPAPEEETEEYQAQPLPEFSF